MKRLMILLAVAAATSPLWAIQGTIHTATDSKKGDIKWQGRSKSYAISFKKGNAMVSAEYPIGDVEELDIEKPAGYDKAVENVKRGNGAAAIGVLTKIVQDYKMLVWDKPAGRYLVPPHGRVISPRLTGRRSSSSARPSSLKGSSRRRRLAATALRAQTRSSCAAT